MQKNKMIKVFIDGREGTTGLKIDERLRDRNDVKVIVLPDDLRKDVSARKEAIASSDVTFLPARCGGGRGGLPCGEFRNSYHRRFNGA